MNPNQPPVSRRNRQVRSALSLMAASAAISFSMIDFVRARSLGASDSQPAPLVKPAVDGVLNLF